MANLKKSERSLNEGSGAKYTATLKDPAGTVVTLSNLSTLGLVLYNQRDGSIINSRGTLSGTTYTFQDVKNTNNVTFHATSGLMTWLIQPADNAIVDTTLAPGESETHVAVFKFVYTDGVNSYTDYHTEIFEVEQVRVI
tara:strand:- start:537 stop:953 length:417 start_codon:yes stop_codon:yes gene_type:complete